MEKDLIHKFITKIPAVLRYYFANNLNILFSIKETNGLWFTAFNLTYTIIDFENTVY